MFRKFSHFLFKLRYKKIHNLIEKTIKDIDINSLGLGICVLKQGSINLSDPDLKNCIDYRYAISGIPKTSIPHIISKQTKK